MTTTQLLLSAWTFRPLVFLGCAAVFALLLLGAGVALLNLAEERFAARTGRSEHFLARPGSI